jgi:hypothetical protein
MIEHITETPEVFLVRIRQKDTDPDPDNQHRFQGSKEEGHRVPNGKFWNLDPQQQCSGSGSLNP